MAPVVRRIFTMRSEGASQSKIAEATGVKYSTVLSILGSRIYLGEVQMNGEWFAGHHEAIITPAAFAAAHRGRVKGQARGTDLLSGKVRCGLCNRRMSLDQNGEGRKLYRCHHRGQGCAQPRRTNHGLIRAAALGLELERARTPVPKAGGGHARRSRHVVGHLEGERRKLLRLYYDDKIGPDLFAEEEARLSVAIREAKRETEAAQAQSAKVDDVAGHFEELVAVLTELDIDRAWAAATEVERRILLDELLKEVTVSPGYIDVTIHGAPPLHVLYQEVGLKESEFDRVGGGT